jgi:hypothetical protein
MTKEQIGATIQEIVAQISPHQDLGSLNSDSGVRQQVALHCIGFLDIITEVRTPYGVEVPEDDYMQSVALSDPVACLARRAKEL